MNNNINNNSSKLAQSPTRTAPKNATEPEVCEGHKRLIDNPFRLEHALATSNKNNRYNFFYSNQPPPLLKSSSSDSNHVFLPSDEEEEEIDAYGGQFYHRQPYYLAQQPKRPSVKSYNKVLQSPLEDEGNRYFDYQKDIFGRKTDTNNGYAYGSVYASEPKVDKDSPKDTSCGEKIRMDNGKSLIDNYEYDEVDDYLLKAKMDKLSVCAENSKGNSGAFLLNTDNKDVPPMTTAASTTMSNAVSGIMGKHIKFGGR
jgi:hypothetical protein